VSAEAGPTALETRDLAVEFRIRGGGVARAVDGVDLSVRRGEILALVGESGCGKTTLARTILGLQKPTAGTIHVEGKPLSYRARDLKAYRRRAQLILQDPSGALNPRHTVYEAVAEGLRVHGIHEGEEATVADALSRAGLRPPQRFYLRYPHELSGGMQQRVGIARALAASPALLLMDEPFSSLDALTREQMMVELHGLWDSGGDGSGKSVVMVTHSIPEAAFMADRIVVFSERPARIVHIEKVDLPRPRTLDTLSDPALIAICDRLRRMLVARKASHG